MKLNLEENTVYKILFVLILIVAIGVRIYSWPYGISQVNIDEAMTAINAKAMADGGVDMFGTSFPVYLEAWQFAGQSVMLFYFMAFFFKIFGASMISVRLPMLLVSILSIIVFYDLIKRMFNNKKMALFAMAFVSICPWHLLQSIWSIDCNMFPHFMLFSVYFLYRGISDKKWMLYISMVFFALTMYTYGVSVYVVPFFLLFAAIYLLIKKQVKIRNIIICIIIFLLISSPILTMYVINALKIDTNIHLGPITIQYFRYSIRTNDMIFFASDIGKTLVENFKTTCKVFFLQQDGIEWNGTKPFGTIYHISLIFFFIGIFYLIRYKEKRNAGTFLMGIWLIFSFLLGLIINNVNINRLNIIWFPSLFFSFYGIYALCSNLKKGKIIKYGAIAIYSVLFISFTIYLYGFYTNTIDMASCFSQKFIDAMHYASSTLERRAVYRDPASDIYIKFQDILDNTTSEHIEDKDYFLARLKNRTEEEAFVVSEFELNDLSIDITHYNHQQFGSYFVIY